MVTHRQASPQSLRRACRMTGTMVPGWYVTASIDRAVELIIPVIYMQLNAQTQYIVGC